MLDIETLAAELMKTYWTTPYEDGTALPAPIWNEQDRDAQESWRAVARRATDLGAATAITPPRVRGGPSSFEETAMQEHIMQFFAYEHLPEHLQAISKPFGVLAQQLVATLPRNQERTVALRKLLEAKDAAVRARLAKEPE